MDAVNILFCFFNADYWLYAVETYFYNLYYLFLVGYVAKSYLLKYRQIINFKQFLLDPQNLINRNRERTIFFIIFGSVLAVYTALMVTSVVLEVQEQDNDTTVHC